MKKPSPKAIAILVCSAAYQILCYKVPGLPTIDYLTFLAIKYILFAGMMAGIYFACHQYIGVILIIIYEDILGRGNTRLEYKLRSSSKDVRKTPVPPTNFIQLEELAYEVH